MTNKTVTLSRELAERLLVATAPYSTPANPAWYVEELGAALADPVPPAGGEVKPALYLDAKGFEIVTSCLTVSACIDVRAHQAGELFDHYRPHGLVPVYGEDTVTRLQAEVERLNSLCVEKDERMSAMNASWAGCIEQRDALQAELTKARELLAEWDGMWSGGGIHNGPLTKLRAATKSFFANQSAPAAKDGE